MSSMIKVYQEDPGTELRLVQLLVNFGKRENTPALREKVRKFLGMGSLYRTNYFDDYERYCKFVAEEKAKLTVRF